MSRRARLAALVGVAALGASPAVSAEDETVREEVIPDRSVVASAAAEFARPGLFEAAAVTSYAAAPIRGGVNPFGAGFGGRFGFNLRGAYLGASAVGFLGGSDVGATDQAWLFGPEVGYSFRVGPYLIVRPVLGFGDALLTHTEPGVDVVTSASGGGGSSSGAVSTSVNQFYAQPSLLVMFTTGHLFLGADGYSLVLPGITYGPAPAQQTTWISYGVEGQLGFRL